MITSSCFLERLIRLVKIKVSQREQTQKEEHRKTVLSGLVLVLAQLSVFIEQGGIPRITEEERQKRMLAPDDSSDDDGNGSEDVDNAQRLRSISGVILVIPSLMMKTRALKETDANLVHWALLYVDLWGTKNCIYRGKITQMREMENEKTAAEQRPWEQQNHCPSPSFRLPHPLPCLNIG
ncbi:Vps51/Vps67 family (components of vesicular transport) protein [Actinidia rufa]|uniref:Vps51/Vps67 family (Components of vesicular transport) protein n=1 Tax=Actinidia rufa TaxID=165716 RepID=A0A7J0GPP1_9ERIC|nr:Vps51/Vps67 family (components of vesicular transport) protein [Actinidia rufa]